MFGDPGEGECTASVGPMGHMSCRNYPACGCEQSKPDTSPDLSHLTEEELSNLFDLLGHPDLANILYDLYGNE